jgi:diguanylate cyclase (GGDEF)-like protein/PAS domain S-box-containing protein
MPDAGAGCPFAAASSAELTLAMPVAVHTSTHPLLPTWCAATACDNTGISAPHNTAKAASQAVKRCEELRENMPTSLAAHPCEGLPLLPATQRPMTQPHAPTPPTHDGAHPPGTGTGAGRQADTPVDGESADAALRREHDTLQLILDHAPIGIWLQDGTGKIAFVNKAFCGAMGIAEERFLAVNHYVELIPEAFREQCLASDAKALASDGISVTNQQLPFVDGQVHDLQVIKIVKRDDQGNPAFLVGLSLDVTAEQARLKALTASEERLRMALAAANQAWFEVDVPTGRVTLSPEYAQLIGHDLLVQQTSDMALWQSQVHPDDVDHALGVFRRVVQQGGPLSADYRRATATGGWKWLRSIGKVAERDAAGNALRVVGIHTDISVLKAHEQQLEHMAHYDALTGLPNRVLLADRLRQAMAHTARQGQRLAVVYLDLDGFKAVNDTHGHAMGDRLLATLAQRMQTALREGDTVCRLGGDEFVAVMLDVPDADAINPLLARLMGATTAPVTLDGQTLIPAASVGVTFYPQATEVDGDQLLRQADHAMYQAKQAGTNSHAVFDTVGDQDTRQRLDTLTRLRQALQDDEFVLHFQPKVHMGTGQVVGLEALVRWQHPTRGLLPPAQFLPVLQGHPLSIDLGNWVLAAAIAQAASWRDNGLQLPVSINIDGYHLQHPDFVEHLRQVLARHPQLRPGDVELEVLESSAIEDLTRANAVMTQCAALGCGLCAGRLRHRLRLAHLPAPVARRVAEN